MSDVFNQCSYGLKGMLSISVKLKKINVLNSASNKVKC